MMYLRNNFTPLCIYASICIFKEGLLDLVAGPRFRSRHKHKHHVVKFWNVEQRYTMHIWIKNSSIRGAFERLTVVTTYLSGDPSEVWSDSQLYVMFMYIEIWIGEQRYLSDNLQQKIIPVKQFIVTRSAKRATILAAFSGCPLRLLHNKASIKLCIY